VLTLNRKFILLAPTSRLVDVPIHQVLNRVGADFFPLDTNVRLLKNGALESIRNPADLFAKFSPESVQPQAAPRHAVTPSPRYAIRKGLGVWKIIFDGKEADVKHERGIFYVAHLLTNPPDQPIHALDLQAKIPELYRKHLGLTEIHDPATGKAVILESHARLQERNLGLDDAQAMRAIWKKQKELEAILDDESESEPVKAEALRELEEIVEFQRKHSGRTRDSAQKTARIVRQAIMRFHTHIQNAVDAKGNRDPVLAPFANHLKKHLLVPSTRFGQATPHQLREGIAGCFIYEPQPGIVWSS
jgi:hypothetical protein